MFIIYIIFTDNKIGSDGVHFLAIALKINRALGILNLEGNKE